MGKCAKQLTDAVAVARAARVTRGAVGCGDTQRRAGVFEAGELRIFSQAFEYTATGVGDDEFECAIAGGIGDDSGLRAPAMFEHIILKLAEGAHQAGDKTLGQARRNRRVFSVHGPLLPGGLVGTVPPGREARQGKHAGAITGCSAADCAVAKRTPHLLKDRRLDRDRLIGIGRGDHRHRELDEWPDPSRPGERDRPELGQSPRNCLPQEIVNNVEVRADAPRLVQNVPHIFPRSRSTAR